MSFNAELEVFKNARAIYKIIRSSECLENEGKGSKGIRVEIEPILHGMVNFAVVEPDLRLPIMRLARLMSVVSEDFGTYMGITHTRDPLIIQVTGGLGLDTKDLFSEEKAKMRTSSICIGVNYDGRVDIRIATHYLYAIGGQGYDEVVNGVIDRLASEQRQRLGKGLVKLIADSVV